MRTSCILAAAVVLAATPARGDTLDASITTILAGRQDPRDGVLYSSVPLYQNLAIELSDVHFKHVDDFKLVVSGWGEVTLAGQAPTLGAGADLDVGFVEGKLFDRRLMLRLGRQLVFGGAAHALPLDGASLTLRIIGRVYVNAWGGVPVTPRFATHLGDAAAGARLFWRPTVETELGASFAEIVDGGRQARQDLGVDARWRPGHGAIVLTGYALLSLLELRLAEGDAAVRWQPTASFEAWADYRRTSPDLFLPRGSILAVFSQETRDEAGANLYWRARSRLRFEGDWHAILDGAGFGHRGGGRVSAALGPAFATTLAAEVRFLSLATGDGYVQGRLYAVQRLSRRFVATADVDVYSLEQPINGTRLSVTGAATLGWDFLPRWRAVVTGIADSTPLVAERFECMGKLVYNASWRLHEVR